MTTPNDALQRLIAVADELCDAVDNAADDIGGSRPVNDILAELGPAVDAARLALLDAAQSALRPTPPSSDARAVLEEVAEALDEALGDSDITHLEDAELREQHPVQWACSQVNRLLQESVVNDTAQPDYKVLWERDSTSLGKCLQEIHNLRAIAEDRRARVAVLEGELAALRADGGSTKPDTATVTDTMLSAARRAEPKVGREACLRIYRAMLAAVPSPEEGR